ncbi:MAG: NAD(+)/NADH kinase [Kiritimatiellae bacterium]|nr:NAD(+)/NADH kinase [Kiritimatiellia bacterium]
MHSVGFYVNQTKMEAATVCDSLRSFASSCGLKVCGDGDTPEAVVVLGGDGTMLSAVHVYPGIPLLGLNLGSLGYLTGVERPFFEDAIRSLSRNEFIISHRTALEVKGEMALNDVVISRATSGHAALLELEVNGVVATRFNADGIVIATPTGSTAYSLAAGGPILLPDSESFVITPICPHALSSRPLVVRDTSILNINVIEKYEREYHTVFADGISVAQLTGGDVISIKKSEKSVPLIQLRGYDPCEVLAHKLGWSGSAFSK